MRKENEEAIEIIKANCYFNNPLDFDNSIKINRALDMAIKALEEQRPKAKFILAGHNPNFSPFDNSNRYILKCSNCFGEVLDSFKYCQNCGARMEGDEDDRPRD